ncbi:hypothetical protein T08_12708 [Trichinella sp. T8]|nr:hypothetical protein T08_12708 [Trichinella sp. T8]
MLEQYFFLYSLDNHNLFEKHKKNCFKEIDVSNAWITEFTFFFGLLLNSTTLKDVSKIVCVFQPRPSEIAPFTSVPENSDFAKKNMHAVDAVSGPKISIVDNRLQNCGIEQNKLCVCPFHLLVIFEYDEISDLLVKNSPMHGLRGDLLTWFDMRQFKSNTLCNLHDLITKQNLKFSGKEEYFIVRLKYASHIWYQMIFIIKFEKLAFRLNFYNLFKN